MGDLQIVLVVFSCLVCGAGGAVLVIMLLKWAVKRAAGLVR